MQRRSRGSSSGCSQLHHAARAPWLMAKATAVATGAAISYAYNAPAQRWVCCGEICAQGSYCLFDQGLMVICSQDRVSLLQVLLLDGPRAHANPPVSISCSTTDCGCCSCHLLQPTLLQDRSNLLLTRLCDSAGVHLATVPQAQ